MRDTIRGFVKIELRKDGKLIEIQGKNLVVDSGRNLLAQIVSSAGATKPSHIALGSSTQAVAPGDAILVSEIVGSRTAIGSDSVSGSQITYNVTVTATGSWTVQEVGIFNAAVAGVMLARFLTTTISMVTGDTLDITWTLTFGD